MLIWGKVAGAASLRARQARGTILNFASGVRQNPPGEALFAKPSAVSLGNGSVAQTCSELDTRRKFAGLEEASYRA